MRAFKFRGETNPEFVTDILQNNRLHCASWHDLNDPMEGTYDTLIVDPSKRSAALQAIREHKGKLRVCSLSDTYKSHAMWAYYASDFKGVAIEIDFPTGCSSESTMRPVPGFRSGRGTRTLTSLRWTSSRRSTATGRGNGSCGSWSPTHSTTCLGARSGASYLVRGFPPPSSKRYAMSPVKFPFIGFGSGQVN